MWWIIGLLSIPYSFNQIKKDITSIRTDFKTTVTDEEKSNQKRIKNEFDNICKAVGIKLDENNNPINKQQYVLGIEFLQYKGHSQDTINIFYETFMKKYEKRQSQINNKAKERKNIIKETKQYNIMVFRHNYFGYINPTERMKKLNNTFWGDMVYQSTYIHGMQSNEKFTEVWTIKLPIAFKRKDIKELYRDACREANIDVGSFIGE